MNMHYIHCIYTQLYMYSEYIAIVTVFCGTTKHCVVVFKHGCGMQPLCDQSKYQRSDKHFTFEM